jgi:DNA-binding transcriptional ArsR family regulator
MVTVSGLAATAAVVGHPARAAMLTALMDGRALTAAELARVAGVTPQTASGHLAQLTEGGLLALERQGRHRYHRLASAGVARMIEGIMAIAAHAPATRPIVTGPKDAGLRRLRTCYDHLAGEIAVAMADRMRERGHVTFSADGGLLSENGAAFLHAIGARFQPGQVFCRPCLDWSERRPHLGGTVGAALLKAFVANGWLRRQNATRAMTITPAGVLALRREFGIE